ncbi:MAG: hypothetical protein ACM359_02135 [Bacillota bacterium]
MAKRVVLVGHCGPDSSYLRTAIKAADRTAQILSAESEDELTGVISGGVDLVLLNRQIDFGFPETEGVELIRRLRQSNPQLKTMLVSNYPEAQAAAVAAGALPGFGKRELGSPHVVELLKSALAT